MQPPAIARQVNKIKITPNPASDEFFVIFDQPLAEDDMLFLYDQTGKMILSEYLLKNKNQYAIKTANLDSGIYFGKLRNNGNQILEKIVIIK